MKIRWPSFSLPPINLWNAPHQPALEDIMTAAEERDAVQDQLCARIDELERDKEVLASQVDRIEERLAMLRGQADALHRIGSALDLDPGTDLTREAPERVEALAAHVERLNNKLADINNSLYGQNLLITGWHLNGDTEPMDTWFEENDWEPEPCGCTSLARVRGEVRRQVAEEWELGLPRLKAEWQAEALDWAYDQVVTPSSGAPLTLETRAIELRRQAEGGEL